MLPLWTDGAWAVCARVRGVSSFTNTAVSTEHCVVREDDSPVFKNTPKPPSPVQAHMTHAAPYLIFFPLNSEDPLHSLLPHPAFCAPCFKAIFHNLCFYWFMFPDWRSGRLSHSFRGVLWWWLKSSKLQVKTLNLSWEQFDFGKIAPNVQTCTNVMKFWYIAKG